MKGIAMVASQMTVGMRLFALVALLCATAIVVGLAGLAGMQRSNRALETVYLDRVVPLQQLKTIADAYDDSVIDAVNKANIGLLGAEDALQALRAARGRIKQEWAAYQATYLTEEESRLAAEANQRFDPADREVVRVEQVLAAKHGRVTGELIDLEGPLYAAIGPIHGKVTELADLQLRVAKAEYDKEQVDYGRVRALSFGLLIAGILLGAFLGYRIVRDLLRQLGGEPGYAAAIASRVAGGDLATPIALKKGDTGSLLFAMQNMVAKLAQTRTEQEHAEQALRESEARFRKYFESSLIGMAVTSPQKGWVEVNDKLCEILGYSRNELAHLSWADITYPEDLAADVHRFERMLAGEIESYSLEKRFVRKDGRIIHTSISITCLRRADGSVDYVLGLMEDITARKQAEAALAESEARYRHLFETMAQGVVYQDAGGQIIAANPAAERILGLTLDEICGRTARDRRWRAIHEDGTEYSCESHPAMIALATGKPAEGSMGVFNQREKRYRWISINAVPIFTPGTDKSSRVYTTFSDITEQRQATKSLRESEMKLRQQAGQLAEADRRKDEFLAVLAHELRNPLTPISNALQLLKRSDDEATIDRALGMAERQVGQLVRLVDDLLDISRITRGKITLHKERVSLGAVIQSALETSRPHIEMSGHQLTVELPEEPVHLEADLTRLAQAVSNLLINAAKFTEPGGHIQLRAHCEGNEVAIAVQDTGIGIPEAELPKLFGLFAQVEQPPGHRRGGLGIGLALVKSLVELHGGRAEAASPGVGQGSTFTIRLPLVTSRPPPESPDKEKGAEAPVQTRRILVVDDEADVADSMAMLLKICGHEVVTAYDGATAIEAARAHRPEVVLLDIGMPGMDGYEVARRLRELPELQGVRLIALTGWGQEEDRRRSQAAGFDHHLVKPVDLPKLEALLSSDTKPIAARQPTGAG